VPESANDRRDEVRLAVPAAPEFVRLARVTATGLASRVGFTYDEVDDLRLAIDELCYTLIGTKGRPGRLSLRYRVTAHGLDIVGTGEFDDEPVANGAGPVLSELSSLILAALVDEYQVERNESGQPSFRLLKTRDDKA
jgi:hypothetical protein